MAVATDAGSCYCERLRWYRSMKTGELGHIKCKSCVLAAQSPPTPAAPIVSYQSAVAGTGQPRFGLICQFYANSTGGVRGGGGGGRRRRRVRKGDGCRRGASCRFVHVAVGDNVYCRCGKLMCTITDESTKIQSGSCKCSQLDALLDSQRVLLHGVRVLVGDESVSMHSAEDQLLGALLQFHGATLIDTPGKHRSVSQVPDGTLHIGSGRFSQPVKHLSWLKDVEVQVGRFLPPKLLRVLVHQLHLPLDICLVIISLVPSSLLARVYLWS